MSAHALARGIRLRPLIAAALVALLALLVGPSLRPHLALADATPHASATERSSTQPDPPLLRPRATARTHAPGTSPSPTASLSAHVTLPTTQPPAGRVGDGRPESFGATSSQQPSSRGPPR
jgi:hypothetical protein